MSADGHKPDWLYIVFAEPVDKKKLTTYFQAKYLGRGLFLVASHLTQSGLYHSIRDRVGPSALFVGRLDEAPRFTNMASGSQKWLELWLSKRQP